MDAKPIYLENKSDIGILMIHGFTSTPSQFKELSQFFYNKGYFVYAPVLAGHGTTPEDMINTCAKDWCDSAKKAFLELKSKTNKVFLIGNSFGGNLALKLARENEVLGVATLGAPVYLRHQFIIKLRYYLYGWMRSYYRKPKRVYKLDYTDLKDIETYPVIPVKCLGEFLNFLKEDTIKNISKVKAPILIAHASVDPVVNPKSAQIIFNNIGSEKKELFLFESREHITTEQKCRQELFKRIDDFLTQLL